MESKTFNIIKLAILGVIAVVLILILVFLLKGNTSFEGIVINGKNELIYDKTFNEEVKNIDVSTYNNDIMIKESNSDEIRVQIYDTKEVQPEVSIEEDTLQIVNKYDKKRKGFLININNNSRIVISVPKNNLYNLKVEGTSSDLSSKLNLGDVDILTVSGDIVLKEVINADIKTTSGDVTLKSTNDIKVKTISGDIEINKINNKLEMETTSGDITIDEADLKANSKIRTVSGDVEIDKANNIYVSTSTVSGDSDINKNNRHADYELNVKTTSGDITVNN